MRTTERYGGSYYIYALDEMHGLRTRELGDILLILQLLLCSWWPRYTHAHHITYGARVFSSLEYLAVVRWASQQHKCTSAKYMCTYGVHTEHLVRMREAETPREAGWKDQPGKISLERSAWKDQPGKISRLVPLLLGQTSRNRQYQNIHNHSESSFGESFVHTTVLRVKRSLGDIHTRIRVGRVQDLEAPGKVKNC